MPPIYRTVDNADLEVQRCGVVRERQRIPGRNALLTHQGLGGSGRVDMVQVDLSAATAHHVHDAVAGDADVEAGRGRHLREA